VAWRRVRELAALVMSTTLCYVSGVAHANGLPVWGQVGILGSVCAAVFFFHFFERENRMRSVPFHPSLCR
jgi:hypothetical protein